MLLVSDVHGAWEALAAVAGRGEPLLVLGDLANLVDYRTMDGLLVEVFGRQMVAEASRLRWSGDAEGARRLWRAASQGREAEVGLRIRRLMAASYAEAARAVEGTECYLTYGNVDDPGLLAEAFDACFVDAEVVEIEGLAVGFAGGGIGPEPGSPGLVTEDQMRAKLAALGDVDVLCTHVAPAVAPLGWDVVAGSAKSSEAVLEYLQEHRPPVHYFGDVHQPRAVSWQVGATLCRNVGFFRATGRAVRHG